MNELKQRIHDGSNGLDYVLVGDYYIPALRLDEPEESRPSGNGQDAPSLSEGDRL